MDIRKLLAICCIIIGAHHATNIFGYVAPSFEYIYTITYQWSKQAISIQYLLEGGCLSGGCFLLLYLIHGIGTKKPYLKKLLTSSIIIFSALSVSTAQFLRHGDESAVTFTRRIGKTIDLGIHEYLVSGQFLFFLLLTTLIICSIIYLIVRKQSIRKALKFAVLSLTAIVYTLTLFGSLTPLPEGSGGSTSLQVVDHINAITLKEVVPIGDLDELSTIHIIPWKEMHIYILGLLPFLLLLANRQQRKEQHVKKRLWWGPFDQLSQSYEIIKIPASLRINKSTQNIIDGIAIGMYVYSFILPAFECLGDGCDVDYIIGYKAFFLGMISIAFVFLEIFVLRFSNVLLYWYIFTGRKKTHYILFALLLSVSFIRYSVQTETGLAIGYFVRMSSFLLLFISHILVKKSTHQGEVTYLQQQQ